MKKRTQNPRAVENTDKSEQNLDNALKERARRGNN